MILEKIFENIDIIKANVSFDAECHGITENSRRVKEGFIFCALKGERVDGNKYIDSPCLRPLISKGGAFVSLYHIL